MTLLKARLKSILRQHTIILGVILLGVATFMVACSDKWFDLDQTAEADNETLVSHINSETGIPYGKEQVWEVLNLPPVGTLGLPRFENAMGLYNYWLNDYVIVSESERRAIFANGSIYNINPEKYSKVWSFVFYNSQTSIATQPDLFQIYGEAGESLIVEVAKENIPFGEPLHVALEPNQEYIFVAKREGFKDSEITSSDWEQMQIGYGRKTTFTNIELEPTHWKAYIAEIQAFSDLVWEDDPSDDSQDYVSLTLNDRFVPQNGAKTTISFRNSGESFSFFSDENGLTYISTPRSAIIHNTEGYDAGLDHYDVLLEFEGYTDVKSSHDGRRISSNGPDGQGISPGYRLNYRPDYVVPENAITVYPLSAPRPVGGNSGLQTLSVTNPCFDNPGAKINVANGVGLLNWDDYCKGVVFKELYYVGWYNGLNTAGLLPEYKEALKAIMLSVKSNALWHKDNKASYSSTWGASYDICDGQACQDYDASWKITGGQYQSIAKTFLEDAFNQVIGEILWDPLVDKPAKAMYGNITNDRTLPPSSDGFFKLAPLGGAGVVNPVPRIGGWLPLGTTNGDPSVPAGEVPPDVNNDGVPDYEKFIGMSQFGIIRHATLRNVAGPTIQSTSWSTNSSDKYDKMELLQYYYPNFVHRTCNGSDTRLWEGNCALDPSFCTIDCASSIHTFNPAIGGNALLAAINTSDISVKSGQTLDFSMTGVNGRCNNAVYSDKLNVITPEFNIGNDFGPAWGPEIVMKVSVQQLGNLEVVLNDLEPNYPLSVYLLSSCSRNSTIGVVHDIEGGNHGSSTFPVIVGTYYVVIDANVAKDNGAHQDDEMPAFRMSVQLTTSLSQGCVDLYESIPPNGNNNSTSSPSFLDNTVLPNVGGAISTGTNDPTITGCIGLASGDIEDNYVLALSSDGKLRVTMSTSAGDPVKIELFDPISSTPITSIFNVFGGQVYLEVCNTAVIGCSGVIVRVSPLFASQTSDLPYHLTFDWDQGNTSNCSNNLRMAGGGTGGTSNSSGGPQPESSVTFSPISLSGCAGQQVTVTASGATNYNWYGENGGVECGVCGSSYTFTLPSGVGSGYFGVSDAGSACPTGYEQIPFTINPSFTVSANASPSVITSGNSATLTASGAPSGATYTWTPGGMTGSSVTVSPTSGQSYTVTATHGGCSDQASVFVGVTTSGCNTAMDEPSGAPHLLISSTVGQTGTYTGTVDCATVNNAYATPSCGNGYIVRDVWIRLTAQAAGNVEFLIGGGPSANPLASGVRRLAVYRGTSFAPGTLIGCSGNNVSSVSVSNNEKLWVRVWGNNASSGGYELEYLQTSGPTNLPDLAMVSSASSVVTSGGWPNVFISAPVENLSSNQNAGVYDLQLRVSNNATLSSDDLTVYWEQFPALNASSSRTLVLTNSDIDWANMGLPAGTYHLLGVVDAGKQVAEANEGNNVHNIGTFTVTSSPVNVADVVVADYSATDRVKINKQFISSGEQVEVYYKLKNEGNVTFTGSNCKVGFYYVEGSPVWYPNMRNTWHFLKEAYPANTTFTPGHLWPGSQSGYEHVIVPNNGMTVGQTGYIIVVPNHEQFINEGAYWGRTEDIGYASFKVTALPHLPDHTVTNLTPSETVIMPCTAFPNNLVSVNWTTANIGPADDPNASYDGAYMNTQPNPFGAIWSSGSNVPLLLSGQSSTQLRQINKNDLGSLSAGQIMHLGIIVNKGTNSFFEQNSNNDEYWMTVQIHPSYVPLNAQITSGSSSVCVGGSATFSAASCTNCEYDWDYGDGTTESNVGATRSHTYTTAGTYTVTVNVSNPCVPLGTNVTHTIVVAPANALADITAPNPATVCVGSTVNFAAANSAGNDYAWSFGDGGSAIVQNPLHSYTIPGTYSVGLVVSDPNGCAIDIDNLTVQVGGNMTISGSVTDESVQGQNDGSIDLTVSGGLFPYSYAWLHGSSTEDPSGLAPGTYSVTVTDVAGCTATSQMFTVLAGAPPCSLPDATVSPLTAGPCVGSPTTFSVASCTGCTYSWDMGDGTTINNQSTVIHIHPAGVSTVTVDVTNQCGTSTGTASVSTVAAPIITWQSLSDTICLSESSALFQIANISGETYVWDFGDGNTAVGSSAWHAYANAGTYPVSVMADNGTCTTTETQTVFAVSEMTLTGAVTNESGQGQNDGSIDLTISGGLAPYSFTWSNGATTEDLTNVTAGTYSVTVTDNAGCVSSFSATVGISCVSPVVVWGPNFNDSVCHNGQFNLEVVPEFGVTYEWTIWGSVQFPGPSMTLGASTPGTQTISLKAMGQCDTVIVSRDLYTSPQISLGAVVTPSSYNQPTGGIDLTVQGGTPSLLQYDWQDLNNIGVTIATTEDLNNVYGSVYSISVSDSMCSAYKTYHVPLTCQPPNAGLSVAGQGNPSRYVVCTDDSVHFAQGMIESGVTYVFSFSDNGQIDTSNTTWHVFTNPGDYKVYLTAEDTTDNCPASVDSLTIRVYESLSAVATITDESSPNALDGSIDLNVSGGSPGRTFFWSNIATTEDITGIGSGQYWVVIWDTACTWTDTFTVNTGTLGPPPLQIETRTLTNISDTWATINLQKTFVSPVPILTAFRSSSATKSVIIRTRIISGNQIQVMVQSTDGNASGNFTLNLAIFEEGVYNLQDHGVKMEVGKVTSTVTAYSGNWSRELRTFQQSYTQPIILGQVMTYNDSKWTQFWPSAGNTKNDPPNNSSVAFGKHAGEDPITTRANETIGYVVFEAGSGSINGLPFIAGLGPDIVKGVGNAGPTGYTYSIQGISSSDFAMVSPAGMDGGNGGWPVIFGPNPIGTNYLNLAFSEDQSKDSEENHTDEQVFFVVFITSQGNQCTTPVNLAITNITPSSCTVNWSSVSGASTYDLEYQLDGGSSWQTVTNIITPSYVLSGLTPNSTYKVRVKAQCNSSASNWSSEATFSTTCPTIQPNPTGIDVTCFGVLDGSATASPTGGQAPYSYDWGGFGSTATIQNLGPGTYTVIVTDANGCTATEQVTISEPQVLSISGQTISESAPNMLDGAIDITVTGGVTPYTFDWGVNGVTEDLTGLEGGQYTVQVTDANGCVETATFTVSTSQGITPPKMEVDQLQNSGQYWQTVNFKNTYQSPVILVAPILPSGQALPVVARVKDVTSTQCKLSLQNPSGDTLTVPYSLYYWIIEEGTYTVALHGIKMEAKKFISTITSRKGAWVQDLRSYQNAYTNPVVLAQVMSYNDSDFSVAYTSSANSRKDPATSGSLSIVKHIGEDTDHTRADETIGYVVIEAGSGYIDTLAFEAGVGADIVRGPGNNVNGYDYPIAQVETTLVAITTVTGMDGNDGCWALPLGPYPFGSSLTLLCDEDQIADNERSHTTENVGYILFGVRLSNNTRLAEPGGGDAKHEEKQLTLKIFPNPAYEHTDFVSLDLQSPNAGIVVIEVFDLLGKKVSISEQEIKEGANTSQLNIQEYQEGILMVRATISGHSDVKKMVIKR